MLTTLDRVRKLVMATDAGACADNITDEMPLFYDATTTSHTAAIAAGGAGFDSLDRVDIAMALEEEFGIEIPDDDMEAKGTKVSETWNTITGIAAYINGRLAKQEA